MPRWLTDLDIRKTLEPVAEESHLPPGDRQQELVGVSSQDEATMVS